jgi:predicted Zn-dependent protease
METLTEKGYDVLTLKADKITEEITEEFKKELLKVEKVDLQPEQYCEVCKIIEKIIYNLYYKPDNLVEKTITEEFKKELLKVDLQPEQYCEVCKIIEKIIHNL